MNVQIIPIGDVSQQVMENISKQLKKAYFPVIDEVEVGSELEIPSEAYNSYRDQYDAEGILTHIYSEASPSKKGRILGITSKDLYNQGLNFIFGQAQKPGKIAIISLRRLKPEYWNRKEDRNLFLNRAAKEAIHELGHTFGLDHCDKKNCVMTFSNRITDTDRKGLEFCTKCMDKIGSEK